jgi:dihydropteroate synthase
MDENWPLLARFGELSELGFPLLAGLSRKSFLTRKKSGVARRDSEVRETDAELATSVANMAAILAGAHIVRVHEVAPARQMADLADRLLAESAE